MTRLSSFSVGFQHAQPDEKTSYNQPLLSFKQAVLYSVAEVQFSPVLPPFFENREPNQQDVFRTEQNQNRTV
jgi:hypothetical protein